MSHQATPDHLVYALRFPLSWILLDAVVMHSELFEDSCSTTSVYPGNPDYEEILF